MVAPATGWGLVESGPMEGCAIFNWGDEWPYAILVVVGTYAIFVPTAVKLLFAKQRLGAVAVYVFITLFIASFIPPWCAIVGAERPYQGLTMTADFLMLGYIFVAGVLVQSRLPHTSAARKVMYARAAAPSEGFSEKEFPLWTPVNEMKAVSAAEALSLAFIVVWLTAVVVLKYLELTHDLDPGQVGFKYMTEVEFAVVDGRSEAAMRARAFGRSIINASLRLIFMTMVSVQRNTVAIHLLGIPFDRAVMYHKLFARAATVLMFVHVGCMLGGGTEARGIKWDNTFKLTNPGINLWPGIVAFCGFNALWITSLPSVRRLKFEAFYFLHWQFIPMGMLFTVFHNRTSLPWIVFGFVGLWIDVAARFFAKTQEIKAISLERLGGGLVRLVLGMPGDWPLGAFDYEPGSYVWLSVGGPDAAGANGDLFQTVNAAGAPLPSWLLFHPITVTRFDRSAQTLELLIKDLAWKEQQIGESADSAAKESAPTCPPPENWAGQLVEAARRIENGTMQLEDLGFHVGGPNGKSMVMQPLGGMAAVCLISAGIGITPMLAIYLDLKERRKTGSAPHIVFTWVTRSAEELAALGPYLGADATVHFTGPDIELEALAPAKDENGGQDGGTYTVVRGRPDAGTIVSETCKSAAEQPVAVLCCGPPSLMDAVERASFHARQEGANALFHRESFLW